MWYLFVKTGTESARLDESEGWIRFGIWNYAIDRDMPVLNHLLQLDVRLREETYLVDVAWVVGSGSWVSRTGATPTSVFVRFKTPFIILFRLCTISAWMYLFVYLFVFVWMRRLSATPKYSRSLFAWKTTSTRAKKRMRVSCLKIMRCVSLSAQPDLVCYKYIYSRGSTFIHLLQWHGKQFKSGI